MRAQKQVISLLILFIIGMHAVPVVNATYRKRMWPFLDWSMYKESHQPGPIQAFKKRLVGVSTTGSRTVLTTDSIGLDAFALDAHYLLAMRAGDSLAGAALLARINERRAEKFVELRLERDAYTVTDTGIVMEPQPALVFHALSAPAPVQGR